MGLVQTDDGKRFWVCINCEFAYPAEWDQKGESLSDLVRRRIEFLRSLIAAPGSKKIVDPGDFSTRSISDLRH